MCRLWWGNCMRFAKNEWISADTASLGVSNNFADIIFSSFGMLLCMFCIYYISIYHYISIYVYVSFACATSCGCDACGLLGCVLFLYFLPLHLRVTFVCSFALLCSSFCESSLVHFRFRSIMSTSATRKCFWTRRKRIEFVIVLLVSGEMEETGNL